MALSANVPGFVKDLEPTEVLEDDDKSCCALANRASSNPLSSSEESANHCYLLALQRRCPGPVGYRGLLIFLNL